MKFLLIYFGLVACVFGADFETEIDGVPLRFSAPVKPRKDGLFLRIEKTHSSTSRGSFFYASDAPGGAWGTKPGLRTFEMRAVTPKVIAEIEEENKKSYIYSITTNFEDVAGKTWLMTTFREEGRLLGYRARLPFEDRFVLIVDVSFSREPSPKQAESGLNDLRGILETVKLGN